MFALKYYVIVLNEGEQLLKKREDRCSFTTSQTALGIKFAPFEDDLERDPWFRTTVDNLLNGCRSSNKNIDHLCCTNPKKCERPLIHGYKFGENI